jgi:hypothetical protein
MIHVAEELEVIELLPCPFCGGRNSEIKSVEASFSDLQYGGTKTVIVIHRCDDSGPKRPIIRAGRDISEAIEKWNKRSNEELSGESSESN